LKIEINPVTFVVGIAVVAVGVVGVLYMQRGAHLELKGSVAKVRTLAMDEASSVAIADFKFVNSSNVTFVVKEVLVSIEDKDGKTVEGSTISELDAGRLFQYYPQLGQKFNDTLLMKNKLPPGQSMDRMIAARFEIPEPALQARKNLIIKIVDLDGAISELRER
jgi:hypothetical protein